MVWKADAKEGNEAAKCKYDVVRYTRGAGVDLGCGPFKAFPHFIGVDNKKDTALFNTPMTPDLVIEDACRLSEAVKPESLDFVFSSHLLEHIVDYRAALGDWWSCLKEGGHLILYLPHRDLYPKMGEPGSNPDHKHDFVPDDILSALRFPDGPQGERRGFEVKVNEVRSDGNEYSFLIVVRKVAGCYSNALPQRPERSCLVIRHGGHGDQLQAAYLLPELKRKGYHITFLTTPKGRDVIEHDPHIDEWYMVDQDQVPNQELMLFWRALQKHYDKVVNLNEAVEGTYLALPGRIEAIWPHSLRHKLLDRNYGEHGADLAEVPFVPEGKFYATKEEDAWAQEYLSGLGLALNPKLADDGPVYAIMFVLAGSSPHKWTPHMDLLIHLMLKRLKRAVVILVGDEFSRLLEQGWEEVTRVKRECGNLSIRKTMALANRCQLVLGPETGVMNAVAFNPDVEKVLLLSHSSPENLSKHWLATTSIKGVAPCYPCHQLHYTQEHCPREESTHAAICQANMSAISIYEPIELHYAGWARAAILRAA